MSQLGVRPLLAAGPLLTNAALNYTFAFSGWPRVQGRAGVRHQSSGLLYALIGSSFRPAVIREVAGEMILPCAEKGAGSESDGCCLLRLHSCMYDGRFAEIWFTL